MTQQNNPKEKIAIGVNAGGRTNYETQIVRLQDKVTFLPGVFMIWAVFQADCPQFMQITIPCFSV